MFDGNSREHIQLAQSMVVRFLEGDGTEEAVVALADEAGGIADLPAFAELVHAAAEAAFSVLNEETDVPTAAEALVSPQLPQETARALVAICGYTIQTYAESKQQGDDGGAMALREQMKYLIGRLLRGPVREELKAELAADEDDPEFVDRMLDMAENIGHAAALVVRDEMPRGAAVEQLTVSGLPEELADALLGDAEEVVRATFAEAEALTGRKITPFKPDFSTPPAAVASLEEAYRRGIMRDVMLCKDFTVEAGFIVNTGYGSPDFEKLRDQTAAMLEAHFRQQLADGGWPNFDVPTEVTDVEMLPGDMAIVTESILPPGHDPIVNQLFVGRGESGWKVLMPYSDDMRAAWLKGQDAIAAAQK